MSKTSHKSRFNGGSPEKNATDPIVGIRIALQGTRSVARVAVTRDEKPIHGGIGKMLVLSRKQGESLVIGDNITITINRISGNRVTVGIDAPRDVRIVRGELTTFEEPCETEAEDSVQPSRHSSAMPSVDIGFQPCGGVSVYNKAER